MNIRKNFIKIILLLFLAILLATAGYGSFLIFKINQTGGKINVNDSREIDKTSFFDTLKNIASPKKINLRGNEEGRIDILLLGIAGTGKAGKNLTDTIMIASIDSENGQVALLSIPRDLYIEISETNIKTKINNVYQYGLSQNSGNEKKAAELVEKTIENITDIDIDYWSVLSFEGFRKIIDAVGGINIMNERDIFDPRYPGPNFSYTTFELEKGFHLLDGETALKYARMRHNDPEGDFGRAKRQQQVLQSTRNKIFSTGTLLNVISVNKLFEALGDNLKTNIRPEEIGNFIELSKKIDMNNINNIVIDAWNPQSLLKVSHVFYGDLRSFILIPRVGNWSEIKDLAQNIFDTNKIKNRRKKIEEENASVSIINKSGDLKTQERITRLLKESFNYKNVTVISDRNNSTEKETVAYDLEDGKNPFTLDELIIKLPSSASFNLPPNYQNLLTNIKTDIVVVLGEDIVSRYNMEENSFEEYNESENINEYSEFAS